MIKIAFFFSRLLLCHTMTEPGDAQPSEYPIDIVLPQQGLLYETETLEYILSKPKLLPLKSVSLEKLEKMQKDADEKIKASREADLVNEK